MRSSIVSRTLHLILRAPRYSLTTTLGNRWEVWIALILVIWNHYILLPHGIFAALHHLTRRMYAAETPMRLGEGWGVPKSHKLTGTLLLLWGFDDALCLRTRWLFICPE